MDQNRYLNAPIRFLSMSKAISIRVLAQYSRSAVTASIFKSLHISTMGPRLVRARTKRTRSPVGLHKRLIASAETSSVLP